MEICGDNRFQIIENAKQKLIQSTNIETSEKEMEVLDSILFRMWQMGWLPVHANWQGVSPLVDTIECTNCGWQEISDELASKYCPECGAKMDNWKEMQEIGLPSVERVENNNG